MSSFYIPEILPLEDFVRESSLRFLTQVYRNLGTFSYLTNSPYIRRINGEDYAEDGNHRCLWNMINGIFTIDAQEEIPNSDTEKITLIISKSVKERGIFSFNDLFNQVKNPLEYSMDGPITHRITKEDLANPRYFLRI